MVKKTLIALVLIAVISAAVYGWYRNQNSDNGPLTLYGNVDIRELSLAFRQGGRITSLAADEGDQVEAGQLVAELDPEPFRNALRASEARVMQARAMLAKLESGSRPQEIEQAREIELQAEAVLANRQREFTRLRELAKAGATSQQSLDSARYALDEARARVAAAKATLSLLEEGPRQQDIEAARAQLAMAEAEAAQTKTALSDTRLVVPDDGTVLSRVVEPGAMVQPGSPVFSLSLGDPVYVRAYVSEPRLGEVPPGTSVTITTDSADRSYSGKIGFVSPRAEFTPKSVQTEELRTELVYRLRIVVQDSDERLLQGMPVTITLDAS
ncbi:secretion protein HlyD [Marinobacter salinus]|uniref:Secretion protein HlyD n=1 Tax=Marinobacter salinus TaxID=1874317 RepID=A0A1D9GL66_9GAMM|nr:secretion protein HlyD [Marinobacter salinus]AOY88383.1 secretion protein HlyD [Marinobacter salinus]